MFCSECGSGVESNSLFCANCGTRITREIAGSSRDFKPIEMVDEVSSSLRAGDEPQAKSQRFSPLVLTVSVVVLIVGGVLSYEKLPAIFNILENRVSSEGKGPTQNQVKRDCDQIAESTIYVEFIPARSPGSIDRPSGKELPLFMCAEVKILGTSVDGQMAHVVTDVAVKYALDAQFGAVSLRQPGLFNWIRGKDWSEWDGFKSTRPRKGDTRLYRVTFKYRQFDTGWRLEGYS